MLDAAVQGDQEVEVSVEQAAVRSSLERLTGASPGRTSKDWLQWWEANKDRWRSADLSRPRQATGSGPEKS